MKMRLFVNKHWKSITWGAFILITCSLPGDELNRVKLINIPHMDKLVHLVLYLIFSLLLISENNAKKYANGVTVNAIITAAGIALGYGAMVELLQYYIFTSRSAELWDMIANTLGFIAAAFAYQWVNRVTDGYI